MFKMTLQVMLKKRFDTWNYEINRPLLIGKYKKVIGFMKAELGGKTMTEFVGLRTKTYSYLIDDGNDKKAKGAKKMHSLMIIKFLLNNEIILKSQQRFKSKAHNEYTEEINKIALSSNDDKRLQAFDRITSYPYGANAGKVCKTAARISKYKMINFDDYTNENKKEQSKMSIYSRSSIQNINNKRFWIRKNNCVIKFHNLFTRY